MKKVLSLAVLFAGISLATFAQEQKDTERSFKKERKHPRMERKIANRTPEEIAKMKTEQLDKRLKFTDAQRTEVYAVQLEQAKRAATHRDEMRKLQSKWREEMKGSQEKMGKILTPEQKEQLKESYAQRRKGEAKGPRGEYREKRTIENKMPATESTEG
jgi:protein CpxP